MSDTFISTRDGVALTLAARYGRLMKDDLQTGLAKSDNPVVRKIGKILLNQAAGGDDIRYVRAANVLAKGAADRPIEIRLPNGCIVRLASNSAHGVSARIVVGHRQRSVQKAAPKKLAAKKPIARKAPQKPQPPAVKVRG